MTRAETRCISLRAPSWNVNRNLLVLCLSAWAMSAAADPPAGRGQWSTAEAWAWNQKVGVIRGFNELGRAYPSMSVEEVLRKARSLGYSSVRTGDYYQTWRRSPSEAKQRLRATLDLAQAKGLTVAPVMFWVSGCIPGAPRVLQDTNAPAWQEVRAYVRDMVGEFHHDERIVLWDLLNEPVNATDYHLAKQLILWAREAGPSQPLTSSVLWTGPKPSSAQIEVEQMADVHNFHLYDCSTDQMTNLESMVACIQGISDRPIVCTECLARPRGDTFGRILPAFSQHHIHWYNWGLYTCDANWTASWSRSTYDPHEPWFHDVLHPDGEPYDWRDLELVRNFHFAKPGETPDPGVEVTDRWLKERAWRWFVLGPMRAQTYRPDAAASWAALWQMDAAKDPATDADLAKAQAAGCDGLRIRLDYAAWQADPSRFCRRVDDLLALADRHGMSVMPVLLTDSDANHPAEELAKYVRNVVKTFGRDGRVYAWELYYQPGGGGLEKGRARALLREVFRTARFEFPGQPLTATPAARVQDFTSDFDYRKALAHQGGLGSHGWDKLQHLGTSDDSLCEYVWALSDVLSIATEQKAAEAGWLLSLANRYGRPVICTEWRPGDAAAVENTLKLFSAHQVRWYSMGSDRAIVEPGPATAQNATPPATRLQKRGLLDPQVLSEDKTLSSLVKQFRYQRVMTPRQ